jgi:hypothetical protein
MLSGIFLLAWLLPFAGNVEAFFGLQGWFDRQAYSEAAQLTDGSFPPFSWSLLYLCGSNPTLLNIAYATSIAVLVLFTLGIGTRVTGVLTWVIAVSFTANPAISYDADCFPVILAFYLMIGYALLGLLDRNSSLTTMLFGKRPRWLGAVQSAEAAAPRKSVAANVAVRLLQVHMVIIIVTSGFHKLQFGEWWSGAALWYPLHPPLETTADAIRAHGRDAMSYMTFLSLGAYAALAWQISFPLFAWRRRWWWRLVLAGGAAVGWLATAFIYEEPLFGPGIFIGCLAYLTARDWYNIGRALARVPGLGSLERLLPPLEDDEVMKRPEQAPPLATTRAR